jgi:hypothetical protein
MAVQSNVYGEEIYKIALGQGIYTAELASNIPDGFSAQAFNLVATGDSLENRMGIRPSSVDYKKTHTNIPSGFYHKFFQLRTGDAANPQWGWVNITSGAASTMSFIRGGLPGEGSGDGYMEIDMSAIAPTTGICSYFDRIYFSVVGVGTHRITNFNWTADTITYTLLGSSAGVYGLFSFKDRLWGWTGDQLFFTEVAAPGGYPETWNTATNFINFRGPNGYSGIIDVKVIGNRLLVFTQTGLFSLIVEGQPASWILRLLDGDSISTHPNCAFEAKNIVYYVNTQGVWATNGLYTTNLSRVIEDQFFVGIGRRIHTLNAYEDGMILSIGKLDDTNRLDAPNCRIFYSKLDPIAWTEWGIHNPDSVANTFGGNRLGFITSVTKKLNCFLTNDPTVFVLSYVTDSTPAAAQNTVFQLSIMDGGENKLYDRGLTLRTEPLNLFLKTKYIDGGNPYADKRNKEAKLELYTSDSQHIITTSWDADASSLASIRSASLTDFVVGGGSNLIRVKSDFMYRRCALQLKTSLQTNDSQIKIKDLAILQDTGRMEAEQVR